MGISTSSFNKDRGEALIQLLMIVPEDKFNMESYRTGDLIVHECDSVGCMIGHATILDTKENFNEYMYNGVVSFKIWSYAFFLGFDRKLKVSSDELNQLWHFLFSAKHDGIYNGPKTEHAIARVQYVIDNHELRSDWKDQLRNSNLFYMPSKTD